MEANSTAISKCSSAVQKLWLSKIRENKTFQIREIYNFILVGEDILTHNSNKSAQKLCQHHLMPSCMNLKNQGETRKTIFLFRLLFVSYCCCARQTDVQVSDIATLNNVSFLVIENMKYIMVQETLKEAQCPVQSSFPSCFCLV